MRLSDTRAKNSRGRRQGCVSTSAAALMNKGAGGKGAERGNERFNRLRWMYNALSALPASEPHHSADNKQQLCLLASNLLASSPYSRLLKHAVLVTLASHAQGHLHARKAVSSSDTRLGCCRPFWAYTFVPCTACSAGWKPGPVPEPRSICPALARRRTLPSG